MLIKASRVVVKSTTEYDLRTGYSSSRERWLELCNKGNCLWWLLGCSRITHSYLESLVGKVRVLQPHSVHDFDSKYAILHLLRTQRAISIVVAIVEEL